MSREAPLITLITPGHVSSTPRLVKEADALVDAGYRVHVIAGGSFEGAQALDASILGAARWEFTRVPLHGPGAFYRKALRRIARSLVVHAPFATLKVAARANHAFSLRLGAIAAQTRARLYVGHCIPALPAAALAARITHSAYGFDAEDYHDAENEAVLNEPAERISVHLLQSRLLPGCAHLTAASPLISQRYGENYGVHPRTVLNVFPRAEAPAVPVDPGPISERRPAVAYWFSQTIGTGRGLEAVVAVLGGMRTPVELHLRGFVAAGYASQLQALATRAGLARPIRFLPPGPPAEMARLAAAADLGLSTEDRLPPNRDICLTNKVFIYLLAGIPQLLSDTTAQRALAPDLGDAAILGDLARPELVAKSLDEYLGKPARIAAARRAAWDLAERRYCWDVESSRFLDSIRAVVPLD
jgi:hypothetical protein